MPKGTCTKLFVSSTCYDLSQVRKDLSDFAESLGFEPVLSERDTFPVNPSQNTVNNCLQAVRHADLFVLVVGGRYGSMDENGRSITNLEYMEAAVQGIPKYVFVKKEIISNLSVWRDNPDGNYSSVVDTSKVFDFVSHLKDAGEVWTYPFDNAQDIVGTLRTQLSYLFADCLELRAKMQPLALSALPLGPESRRIFVEKPNHWKVLCFAKVLQERFQSLESKRLDAELGISFGPAIELPNGMAAGTWVITKVKEIIQTSKQLALVINTGFPKAVGGPDEPGDIHRIVHLASRVADGYAQLLENKLELYRISVEPLFEKMINLAAQLPTPLLIHLETYSKELYGRLDHALANQSPGDALDFSLELTMPDLAELQREVARVNSLLE